MTATCTGCILLVRSICGQARCIDDGFDVATDAVTDCRWVRRVAERLSPAEVARGIEQLLEPHEEVVEILQEGSSSAGAARGVSQCPSAMRT
jgi:hypothetical protein